MRAVLILLFILFAPQFVNAAPAKKAAKTVKKAPVLVWPHLSRANSGDITNVRMVQLLLRHRGFYKAGIDEVFGPKTEAAIKAFQKTAGLKVDGVVGPQTWNKLTVRVKRSDKNDAVKAIQQVFDYGYSETGDESLNLTADGFGFFGPKTESAVRGTQKEARLKVDGVVGPQTWCILAGGKVKQ
ncbi:MAG TPA: peptidoglycan-binding protein [Abditibacteriaceae bacterium]|jgi:peptidoglycan hydrolase-like protein with peptidoglycan-binding domain